MDVYNFPEHGNADAYPIQEITDTNSQLTNPLLQPLETMYNESIPELFVDQGMYYPSAPNYGYICTGLESPGDWDDHPRVFGVDGQNIQFVGTQTDSLPYVYYTPNYGYAQSPYNPYNPYIPGAIISTDGSFVGPQQYYIPTYDNGTNSPAYYPMIVQPGSEIFTTDQFMDMNSSSSPATFSLNSSRVATNHTQNKVSEGFKNNGGLKKLNPTNGGVTSNSLSGPASSPMLQGEGGQSQTINNLSNGKSASNHNQLKPTLPSGNSFWPSGNGRAATDKARSTPNCLGEQNRGPRTNTTNTRLTVKAYSTKAGNSDAQGNITISVDQYNKDDFPVDYVNAKFFVIKSYSEDDVHKSIKYNVWSSTPNGNKKLNNAFEEAKNNGCPVFLFFSVNASGQFCGVAEMTGNVDFHKDMDFWQQDKWSGSFPVKWHIIKDVPNPHFRHIILENNEHKPVTNSRDTQEIKYKKGVEMLKVFKKYTSKTSLLDDFMYYENRQKILQEEKARLLIKSYGTPVFVPVLHPPRKLNNLLGLDSKESDINTSNSNNVDGKPTEEDEDVLRFRSLAINSESGDVLTVGSMPVKVKGFGESSGYVTVGTIPLDYKVFEVKESDGNKKG